MRGGRVRRSDLGRRQRASCDHTRNDDHHTHNDDHDHDTDTNTDSPGCQVFGVRPRR
jgi:hypothetical protein